MATNFKLKRSSVANKRPGLTNLELGELALNTYDGYLFTERDGLGITTITNLTPWFENYGAASIVYNNSVGIGTTDPIHKLDLRGSLGGIDNIFAPHVGVTKTFTVKVVTKTAKHRYNGSGSSLGYTIDGEQSPLITLTPGRTYRFDQADNSNSSHQIRFYLEADKTTLYSSGVTYNGTAGQAGSYTQIVVGDETPVVLHYQCVNHAYMGNAAQNNSNVVNTNYAAILRGGLNVSGAETILSSATVSDLTNTRVVYAGTSGSLEDSANFTFNNNTLSVLNLDIDGLASFDDIVVSAASTFTGAVDVNGDIDVDGHTELDNVNISGVTTFVGNIDANGDIDVDGHTELDNVNIAGVTTFAGSIDANGDLDVDGETELDNLNVAGVSTYAGALDINSDIDVDGHTELDNLNVSGVSTFVGQINAGVIAAASATFTGNVSIAGTLTYQDVTNVDSLGIGTFRTGLNVSGGQLDVGSNIKLGNAGVITATSYSGSGANLTGLTGASAATYGSATVTPVITVDSNGRISNITTATISGGGGGGTGGKFVENSSGIHTLGNVGIGTTTASDKLKVLGDLAFTGALKVTSLGLSGSNGQYLKSVGSGVTWASFPTARTAGIATATDDQTSFSFTYNAGFLDVYVNGVKLAPTEFTATNGSTVVLAHGAFAGDQVEFVSFNTTASGGGGGSGITEVVQDTTPQLGGNLDLNSKIVNGTGNIDYTGNFKASGIATATTFVGALTGNASSATILQNARTIGGVSFNGSANINLPGVNASGNQDTSGTAAVATNVTVSANNSTNETVYPVFVDGATGSQGAETDTGLNYNPSTGRLTAVSYAGDGSALTGISAGVTVQDEGSALSTAGTTLNFVGSGVVASGSGATKTITISGGGGSGNAGFSTAGGNFTVNAGVTTVINTFNINTNTKLSEYTIHLENVNGNIQSQKVLVMNYGAGIGLTAYSSEYGIMFHPNQIADIGVVVTSGICSLTATTKSGITGITTFSLTRQDQS
jgi:hypothetical protein